MRTSLLRDQVSTEHAPPVEAARQAIWRLFEEGYVDEDMATAGLLAVDLGTRRVKERAATRVASGIQRRAHARGRTRRPRRAVHAAA